MAAIISAIPYPITLFGDATLDAVFIIASRTWYGVHVGLACKTNATPPAVSGAENEVPLLVVY
jgi:hypothetical protein